ncbi:hypothetical protein [Yoonia litorea]|uniref:Phosphoadenosine phosphosulfate reductase n=1 Tax=Yoonia litorea TaxID=1123755 RepID=A0A1I6MCZ4_9RHOB|nr:hypothetical protein [Yoonia litorea]SFS13458.1 hypothetical protein SAMN05444714_1550 [Yoonia litorea]
MSIEDRQLDIETNLVDLGPESWMAQIRQISMANGFFEDLGKEHAAGFLEAGNNLFVTFENVDRVREFAYAAEPRGFAYARHDGWSHLALYSKGTSWFRDPAIYAFFDRLMDEGFFDDFEHVVFYGGDGGEAYAAAAYSVVSPGATVIAIRPQATLDAEMARWDPRFYKERRYDFTSRYGYAPEMLDAAGRAFVAYDPYERFDAAHAALFRSDNVTLLPCAMFGNALDRTFDRMGIHDLIIKLAMDKALDRKRFCQLIRARRYDQTYTRDLVSHLLDKDHVWLAQVLCNYMLKRDRTGYFASKLEEMAEDDVVSFGK